MSDLLPANATPQERALSDAVGRVGAVPTPVRSVWTPSTCPTDVLPWLAWAFSVDEWDQDWSDPQKRAVIQQSISVHRRKGTIGAVLEAVQALGIEAQVLEWHKQLPVGDPYTFQLRLDAQQNPITLQHLIKLVDVVNSAKNLRSHLTQIRVGATSRAGPVVAVVALVGSEITVKPGPYALLQENGGRLLTENNQLIGI